MLSTSQAATHTLIQIIDGQNEPELKLDVDAVAASHFHNWLLIGLD